MKKSTRFAIVGLVVVMFVAVGFVVFGPKGSLTGGPPAGGPRITTVYLTTDPNGGCYIKDDGKEPEITVGENKQLAWVIDHSNCSDKQAVVTVGNFRRSATPGPDHCRDATGGTDGIWLFAQPDTLRNRQSHSRIPLTTKRRGELAEGTYYYDICAGANAEKKSDPRLVIDY